MYMENMLRMVKLDILAFLLLGLVCCTRCISSNVPTLSFCTVSSKERPTLPVTLDGSNEVNVLNGSSSCRCTVQATDADVSAMTVSLETDNTNIRDCGKWIEVAKDEDGTSRRLGCANETIVVTDVAVGTGFSATLFVDGIVDSTATYKLIIRAETKYRANLTVSCHGPTMGQATLPTASIISTTTSASTSASSPTLTSVTTHVISDENNDTVILVVVMVMVGVFVVIAIIVLLLFINRRLKNKPADEGVSHKGYRRVFKRVTIRITNLYETIAVRRALPSLPVSCRSNVGTVCSASMPLPKRSLTAQSSGRYDTIPSSIIRHGARDYENVTPVHREIAGQTDGSTAVKIAVMNHSSNYSDKYYIHAGNIHESIDDRDVMVESDDHCRRVPDDSSKQLYNEHTEEPWNEKDSDYVSMHGLNMSEHMCVLFKEKSVKSINKTTSSGLKTMSSNSDFACPRPHLSNVDESYIYLRMDNPGFCNEDCRQMVNNV